MGWGGNGVEFTLHLRRVERMRVVKRVTHAGSSFALQPWRGGARKERWGILGLGLLGQGKIERAPEA